MSPPRPPYKGKGKAPMRDEDWRDDEDSRGRTTTRQTSPPHLIEHSEGYPDHPPVLPGSINIRDFAYQTSPERSDTPYIWAPERIAQIRAEVAANVRDENERNDQDGDTSPTSAYFNDRAAIGASIQRPGNPAPEFFIRADLPGEDRAPFPASLSPTRNDVPLDPAEFPFDAHPFNLDDLPQGVAAPSRIARDDDDEQDLPEVLASPSRFALSDDETIDLDGAILSSDDELSPLTRSVDQAANVDSWIAEGVAGPSSIAARGGHQSERTGGSLSIDDEPSPHTQPSINPLDNANSWIPEGVAGPSTIVRPPTPQREPQRYSDIDTLISSRNDSGQGVDAEDAQVQQVILQSLQIATVTNFAANGSQEYDEYALENWTLPSSSSSEGGSSESSEGLMMAPYQSLRRHLSPTPTPDVSPHLRAARSRSRPTNTGGSPWQGSNVLLRSSSRLRVPSPDVARREAMEAEQRAMERLRVYASMEDPTAQDLLLGYERRLSDWQDGNIRDFNGVFLTRRADSTQLPHGYIPRFARRSLELVEQQRAEMDLFLLSADDDRQFVLPHSTHAPEVSERPDLTENLRTTSLPPTSRSHAGVQVPERAWSTSPGFAQANEQPPIETQSPTLAAASALISMHNTRQPAAEPTVQETEGPQAVSSVPRDSIVRTSVGTGEKRDDIDTVEEEGETAR